MSPMSEVWYGDYFILEVGEVFDAVDTFKLLATFVDQNTITSQEEATQGQAGF